MKLFLSVLFIIPIFSFSQLHHDMISSQGNTKKISSGHYVTQTVGQLSVIGNKQINGFNIGQGFQQSVWVRLINSSPSDIIAEYFPNPFIDKVTFNFTNIINGADINVTMYDTAGRLVYNQKHNLNTDGKLILSLENLSSGSYLINLSNSQIKYFTKLIKK
jgi:hypothetical protein